MADQRVSLVVITRDRRAGLLATLGRLTALPERPRIVVVDNGSRDGTAAAVRRAFPSVDLIALDANRGPAARNLGVERVRTPYVAFSDDDSWWAPGALARAADLLDAHPDLGLVNGHILVGEDERDDPVCLAMATSPLPDDPGMPGRPILSFLGCAVVVRRDAFLRAGGYRPELAVGGEEELLGWDLAASGWALSYVPELVVHHHPSPVRDPDERRARSLRNALWTTWLRRPAGTAWRRSVELVRRAPRDHVTARALVGAAAGVPRVLRRRRLLPAHLEAMRRTLDEHEAS